MQNYKESCQDISYDASTDVLTANCGSNDTPEDSTSYSYSTLPGACDCLTAIKNVKGDLKCVSQSSLVSSDDSQNCVPVLPLYVSKLDKSGSASPDGVSHASGNVDSVLRMSCTWYHLYDVLQPDASGSKCVLLTGLSDCLTESQLLSLNCWLPLRSSLLLTCVGSAQSPQPSNHVTTSTADGKDSALASDAELQGDLQEHLL